MKEILWTSLSIWRTEAQRERESYLPLRKGSSRQEAREGGLLNPLHSSIPVSTWGLHSQSPALHTQPYHHLSCCQLPGRPSILPETPPAPSPELKPLPKTHFPFPSSSLPEYPKGPHRSWQIRVETFKYGNITFLECLLKSKAKQVLGVPGLSRMQKY